VPPSADWSQRLFSSCCADRLWLKGCQKRHQKRKENAMSSNTPAVAGTEVAQSWVLAFTEGWRGAGGAEAFADHFEPWFDPHVRLIQPHLPTLAGHQAFRQRFARPLFALIPDLAGQVERFAIGAECAYVELTLRGTLGGRPISWRVCDRVTLRQGLVVQRESYFDPTPLLRAILSRPRAWPALARAWQLSRRHRIGSRSQLIHSRQQMWSGSRKR
jgi:ketosteroid isomerase-like protein